MLYIVNIKDFFLKGSCFSLSLAFLLNKARWFNLAWSINYVDLNFLLKGNMFGCVKS